MGYTLIRHLVTLFTLPLRRRRRHSRRRRHRGRGRRRRLTYSFFNMEIFFRRFLKSNEATAAQVADVQTEPSWATVGEREGDLWVVCVFVGEE